MKRLAVLNNASTHHSMEIILIFETQIFCEYNAKLTLFVNSTLLIKLVTISKKLLS